MINKNHILNDPQLEMMPNHNNYPNVQHLHRIHPRKQMTVAGSRYVNWIGTHRTILKK